MLLNFQIQVILVSEFRIVIIIAMIVEMETIILLYQIRVYVSKCHYNVETHVWKYDRFACNVASKNIFINDRQYSWHIISLSSRQEFFRI